MNDKLIDKFIQFEEDYNLFELQIFGISLWPVIRFRVYSLIYQKVNNTQINHPKKNVFKSIILIIKGSYLALIKSPFFLKKKSTIIFNHPRKIINENGFYECKYTEHLTGHDAYVFEIPFQDRHYKPSQTPNLVYLDIILTLGRLNSIIGKFKYLKNADINKIIKLKHSIEREFNVKIPDFITLVKVLINKHKIISFLAKKILKQIKPRQLIMTVAYSDINLPFVEQAKRLGIKVIELQHGIMGGSHIAYNFYKIQNFNWYPDEIWVWNDFWANKSKFPIINEKIIVKGFPYLEKYKKERIINNENKKQIIIISQGPFSDKLIDLTIKLNNKLNHKVYQIAYKPHPSELEANVKNMDVLLKQNILISTDNNIYKVFNESYCQIGVNSTALFEGIELGLKTFVYKISGSEVLKDVENAIFINDENDIIDNL